MMNKIDFVKMHGAGNDYIYVSTFDQDVNDLSAFSIQASDRHFGIGGDGVIFIMPSDKADARMRMFNQDGSEAEMCGNGIRCLAKYIVDNKIAEGPIVKVETGRGILDLEIFKNNAGLVDIVKVNMGIPILDPKLIPVAGINSNPVVNEEINIYGSKFSITSLSMGNPHAVIFVKNLDKYPVAEDGALIENSRFFPKRVNVEFVEILKDGFVKQRTWERGSGETLACGTGAAAVCAALKLNGIMDGPVEVELLGGVLTVEWAESGEIFMKGPAVEVFNGKYQIK